MWTRSIVVLIASLAVVLAGCLDSFAPPGEPEQGAPAGTKGFAQDEVDPLRWAVDSASWDPENPNEVQRSYVGEQGASGEMHREDIFVDPNRVDHCGGPPPDPNHANAIGTATGVYVTNDLLIETELTLGTLAVKQTGPGVSEDDKKVLRINVPDPLGQRDHLVRAEIIAMEGHSEVDAGAFESRQTMVAQLVNLSIMDGLVSADVVRAEASTLATPERAEWSTNGTVMTGLKVQDEALVSVNPWFRVDLSDTFGEGSHISLFETWGHIHRPVKPIDGFAADVQITMIRIVLADVIPITPINERVEIAISEVWSHSDFPQDPACFPLQGVQGHAYNLHAAHALPGQPVTLGLVNLPEMGGDESQHSLGVDVGTNHVGVAETRVWGELTPERSWARGESKATDICLLWSQVSGCAVEAQAVHVQTFANATAEHDTWTEGSTVILGLRVLGVEACPALGADGTCRPDPNTEIKVAGLATIILNAQQELETDMPECHAGFTVRGIVIEASLLNPKVIVGESSSSAFYCPNPHI